MTATIHKLDRHPIDSIAAGEVIERPSSVVKELIDNALDAGASVIRLRIENGGIRLISCEDDGSGMSPEDALMAIESHATSKLVTTDDLNLKRWLQRRGAPIDCRCLETGASNAHARCRRGYACRRRRRETCVLRSLRYFSGYRYHVPRLVLQHARTL